MLAELPLQERFSLQGEAFYSGQGYERNFSIADQTFDYKFKADYIQVPLLAKFYIVEGLSVAAGPQFGFKVNEKIDHNSSSTSNGGAINPVNIKTFDFQGTAGLEYKHNSGLFIQGRYSYGFSDVIKNSNSHYHTSVFSAGLGYMF
ncbi:MAG: porin family protein [Aequorivita sp.]